MSDCSFEDTACGFRMPPVELTEETCKACSLADIPPSVREFFHGPVPRRWGRMDVLSRLAVAGLGLLLRETGLALHGRTAGFVAGTACGCLHTDQAFLKSLDSASPSPLLFGYTLPSTAPAEAATFYKLTGPVYSVFDRADPYKSALSEASRLLDFIPGLDLMFFGRLDACPGTVPAVRLNFIQSGAHTEAAAGPGDGGAPTS